jgi:hypothetical protein
MEMRACGIIVKNIYYEIYQHSPAYWLFILVNSHHGPNKKACSPSATTATNRVSPNGSYSTD